MQTPRSNYLALQPGTMIAEYRIERMLGKGGFGLTYLAVDVNLGRRVAIKELLPDGIATRVEGTTVIAQTQELEETLKWASERFLDEARTLAKLTHPNVLNVIRYLKANQTVYMVMDFLEGQSLEQIVRSSGTLPEAQLQVLLRQMMDGLEYCHVSGILHRDIKPGNVLVTPKGNPVLIDFGSARENLGKTVAMTAVVSFGYSPWEQITTNGRQGPWSDIHALAGTTVYLMTGKSPVSAVDRISDPEPEGWLVQQLGGQYSEAFLRGVEWGFRTHAKDRPQSVAEWRAYFDQIPAAQNGFSQQAPSGPIRGTVPDVPSQRVPVPASGSRWIPAGLAALAVVLLLIIVALVWPRSESTDASIPEEQPAPASKPEAPVAEAPAVATPSPTPPAVTPQPAAPAPKPAPAETAPAPVATTPEPAPAPVVKAPESAPAPVVTAPTPPPAAAQIPTPAPVAPPAPVVVATTTQPSSAGSTPGLDSPLDTAPTPSSSPANVPPPAAPSADENDPLKSMRDSADKGDANSQFQMGTAYEAGNGVPQSYADAAKWYQLAVASDNASAETNLGSLYARGLGVKQDLGRAVSLYTKAANQGVSMAQRDLGVLYGNGYGVQRDYRKAALWFGKAAEQGDAVSEGNMGLLYARGWGVPQNYSQAVKWFQAGAEQGDATSENGLGVMYENGAAITRDLNKAKYWYQKAAAQGLAEAQQNLQKYSR